MSNVKQTSNESAKAHIQGDSNTARDSADFYSALSNFIRVYQFRDRDHICCHGISVTQCYALEALVKHSPLTLNELASRLYLDKSTASRVVSTLEKKGFIQRRTYTHDRRAVNLSVTKKGQQLNKRIRQDVEKRDRDLLARFPSPVRRSIIELLQQLAAAAEDRQRTTRN